MIVTCMQSFGNLFSGHACWRVWLSSLDIRVQVPVLRQGAKTKDGPPRLPAARRHLRRRGGAPLPFERSEHPRDDGLLRKAQRDGAPGVPHLRVEQRPGVPVWELRVRSVGGRQQQRCSPVVQAGALRSFPPERAVPVPPRRRVLRSLGRGSLRRQSYR